jgi:hypothetical protein
MILMGLTFFVVAILYNAETCPMWKIFSVPCGSALYKFHCIYISVPVLQSAQGSISGILKDNLWNSLTPPAI